MTKLNWNGSTLSLVYSTFLGGSTQDGGYSIAIDSFGNAYVVGYTESTNFPAVNAVQPTSGGGYDGFVAELNPSGTAFVYSTYLGGLGFDIVYCIIVDSSNNAYVAGTTHSPDFPTTAGALQTTAPGSSEAFVTKLNWNASAVPPLTLVYSTYLGGGSDGGYDIIVDIAGDAFVTGYTSSKAFPVIHAVQPALVGSANAFVSELNPAGSALLFSTYLGGSGYDYGYAIWLDQNGNIYVAGQTNSANFPTNLNFPGIGTYQQYLGTGAVYNAFVTKYSVMPAATLSPNLDFGTWGLFSTSTPMTATLTNTGDGVLQVSKHPSFHRLYGGDGRHLPGFPPHHFRSIAGRILHYQRYLHAHGDGLC